MLYERWGRIAVQFRDEIALRDLAGERLWTFGELHRLGETWPVPDAPVVYPQGNQPEFIFTLLAAWRRGKPACPLETEQTPPAIGALPAGCEHLKITSGTTGATRCICFTGAQLAADAANIVATMGLRREWPNLGLISLAHSYGFSNLVLPLLLHGIPLVLVPAPLPEALRQAVAAHPAVTVAAVPALWRAWHEAGALNPGIRLAISAGALLPTTLERAVFAGTGIKLHNFYGSSECGGIAYDASETPRPDDALAGTPLRNVTLSVNETGCLTVRSAAVGETYWPEPAAGLGRGEFVTSDLVELVGDQVFLRGRASDLINVAGRKLSPATVEQVLSRHPAVRDCLVFGVASQAADRGEHIVACVQVSRDTTVTELRQFLLAQLPAWQVPREWQFVASLSANQRGKISRAEWRRRYLAR